MDDLSYAVIMAGGGGTRLWPLSRQKRPKQFLRLFGERTLFQIAVDRLEGLFPPERICIVTTEEQAEELRKEAPQIPASNYVLEPEPRGTAAALGLAAVALKKRQPGATMVVLTADHFIQNVNRFQQILRAAIQVAGEGYLVTLGMKPAYPATGYGYIQQGQELGCYGDFPAYQVERFTEKPDKATAEVFVKDGGYHWNSGMFIWKVERILEEFRISMPDLYNTLQNLDEVWEDEGLLKQRLAADWHAIQPQTIDYGVMEKAKKVAVLPAGDLGWSDVGSWESIFEVFPTDKNGNIILKANHLGIDTNKSLVLSENLDKIIVTIGVQDFIIIDTKDALLVCPRSEVQKIRGAVSEIKNQQKKFS
jgi:mannose-1-phosphate guanylyltransferase